MKIQHVQLSIPSGRIEEARKFYVEIIGLGEIVRPKGLSGRPGLWLSLSDGQELHLAEDPMGEPAKSMAHVALVIDSAETFEMRLSEAQIPIEKRVVVEGWTRLHFRDPFGNRIELIQTSMPVRHADEFTVDFPKGDLEKILKSIEIKVQQFLDGDQSKLMNWLYRMDVAEKNVRAIWDNVAQTRWARRISELIFQRELQKYFNRRES